MGRTTTATTPAVMSAAVAQAARSEKALAGIRRIYFNTTRRTIQHDLAHAIELIKSLPSEE